MVHTLPDYTTKWRMATIFANIDDAELAARLGSIDTFDRRGNVVWMDDFEASTLKWKAITHGDNAAVALSAASAYSGAQSMALTAGEGATGYAYGHRYITTSIAGKIGLDLCFTVDSATKTLTFWLIYNYGNYDYRGELIYYPATDKLVLTDSAGTEQDVFTSRPLYEDSLCYHHLKLVIDSSTLKYVRVLLNEHSFDASAYSLYPASVAGTTHMRVGLQHVSDHAAVKTIYIDNVIITQNEP